LTLRGSQRRDSAEMWRAGVLGFGFPNPKTVASYREPP
jgi:hypothetical protein